MSKVKIPRDASIFRYYSDNSELYRQRVCADSGNGNFPRASGRLSFIHETSSMMRLLQSLQPLEKVVE